MSSPIVFIHQGAPVALSHLNCALLQARLWNPERSILVLTDEDPQALLAVPGIEVIRPEAYGKGARELRAVYRHFSLNPEPFERACLERWFVLRDFLRERDFSGVWHFDSDVMIYSDLSEETQRVEAMDFTLTRRSGHSSYFRLGALEKFCELILTSYQQEPSTGRLQAEDRVRAEAQRRDRISDMFFIAELSKDPSLRSADLNVPQLGRAVFDANANADKTAAGEGVLREITFIENRPHSTEDPAFPMQLYATLHFQGAAKPHMASHLRPPPGPLPEWSLLVLRQFLSQMRELSIEETQLRKELREAQRAVVTSAPQRIGGPAKIDKAVIKLLKKVQTSRWLRFGHWLGFSRVGKQMQEVLERLGK
jgi:hypothetical protein